MAGSGLMTSQRTRTRNTTLHNQLVVERKLLDKDANCAQRRLHERSKECITILRKLREDSKRMSNIGSLWMTGERSGSRDGKTANTTEGKMRRAVSAPSRRMSRDITERRRPKTAKAAHVLKFERIESLVPEMEVFQVYCHKIKEPVSRRALTVNARDFVPRNMNKFEDIADWSDVIRAADWLDGNSVRGHERRLDAKSPLILAEFGVMGNVRKGREASNESGENYSDNVQVPVDIPSEVPPDTDTEVPPDTDTEISGAPDESSTIARRVRWADALKRVHTLSGAVSGLSRQASINLEQMLKTHDREMRNSGLRSALQSTSQLQQAKVLQQISGLEPVSERELKQKILSAQNALQKDIEAAKQAKLKYSQKMLNLAEKTKSVSFSETLPRSQRVSAVQPDSDSDEGDVLLSPVTPNVRINDEMEKQVASYLENIKPKAKKKESVYRKKESVVQMSADESVQRQKYAENDSEPGMREISLQRLRDERREQQLSQLMLLDSDRQEQLASTTTLSLMNHLRLTQQKLDRLRQCRKDLEVSLRRVDKRRPQPPKIVYSLDKNAKPPIAKH